MHKGHVPWERRLIHLSPIVRNLNLGGNFFLQSLTVSAAQKNQDGGQTFRYTDRVLALPSSSLINPLEVHSHDRFLCLRVRKIK